MLASQGKVDLISARIAKIKQGYNSAKELSLFEKKMLRQIRSNEPLVAQTRTELASVMKNHL